MRPEGEDRRTSILFPALASPSRGLAHSSCPIGWKLATTLWAGHEWVSAPALELGLQLGDAFPPDTSPQEFRRQWSGQVGADRRLLDHSLERVAGWGPAFQMRARMMCEEYCDVQCKV